MAISSYNCDMGDGMSNSVAALSFSPLGPGEIRVIDLPKFDDDTNTWASNGCISGCLRTVKLDHKPRYAALSYVWGQGENPPRHWFMCRSSSVSSSWTRLRITPNCWSALWNLIRAQGDLTIWVDAICIDQHNEAEKLDQIPLMGKIFSQADTVFAWLGDGNDETDTAMDYFGIAGHQDLIHRGPDAILGYRPLRPSQYAFWKAVSRELQMTHVYDNARSGFHFLKWLPLPRQRWSTLMCAPGLVDGITNILSRDWISRVWCLQEALLAPKLVLYCGNKHIPWSNFSYSLLYLGDQRTPAGIVPSKLTPWLQLISIRAQIHSKKASNPTGNAQKYFLLPFLRIPPETSLYAHHAAFSLLGYAEGCVVILCLGLTTDVVYGHLNDNEGPDWFLPLIPFILLLLFVLTFLRLWSGTTVEVSPGDAIVREMILRRATEPQDKVYGVLGILQTQFSLALSITGSSQAKLSILYRSLFTELYSKCEGAGRLLFYARGLPNIGEDEWDAPSWIPNLKGSEGSWAHPHDRIEAVRLDTTARWSKSWIRPPPPESDLTEPQLLFSPVGLSLTVHIFRLGCASLEYDPCFIELPVPVLGEQVGDALLNSHLRNIQLLCEPWQAVKRNSLTMRMLAKGVPALKSEWWDFAIQPNMDENIDRREVRQWAGILDTWQSRSSGPQILRRLAEEDLLRLHVKICNNLAVSKRYVFEIALDNGGIVLANGPSGIRTGDEIVAITRYIDDPRLAVRRNLLKGYHEVVGTVFLTRWTRNFISQRSLKHAKLSEMVLG